MLKLKEILAKEVKTLSAEEKAFLRENVAELSAEQKTAYAEILKETDGMDLNEVKELVSKTVQEAIAEKVNKMAEDIVSKFNAGVGDARAKILAGEKMEKDEKKDSQTRLFLKALLMGDKAAAKALTTSDSGSSPDDAQAGLTVPSELLAEVLRIANKQYGLARRAMRYLPFSGPGNSRTIPALGTSVSVTWTDEGTKKSSTQPKFSVVTQTLKKLAAIVPMTEEIIEDSAINLTALVAELFAEAVAKEEDIQFFAGTGSPWTGVLNNSDVNKVDQASGDASQLNADDLLDMIDKTPSGALNGAKFYMHRSVLSVIRKLKDENGQYIFQAPGAGLPGRIWDYEYETSDAFPALSEVSEGEQYILFGNLQQGCIFGDKQQLRVKMLDQATITDTDGSTSINLAEQDMVAVRVVERVGFVVALPKALTVLEASATESA